MASSTQRENDPGESVSASQLMKSDSVNNVDSDSDSDDDDTYEPPVENETINETINETNVLASNARKRAPLALTMSDDEDDSDEKGAKDVICASPKNHISEKQAKDVCLQLDEQPAKRARVSASDPHNIDNLWAEMNSGMSASKPKKSNSKDSSNSLSADLSDWLTPAPVKKNQVPSFSIPSLSDLEARAKAELQKANTPTTNQKRATGLEDVLVRVRGGAPPKPSQVDNPIKTSTSTPDDAVKSTVLDSSRNSWVKFKRDTEVVEELETYKKDKDRYTDRVAFLERSDVREWQYEQRGRKSKR